MSSFPRHPRPAPVPLADATLGAHRGRVRVPAYDRSVITPSVVHIGVGGFHRAHQAVYLDELAQRGITTDWGIVGVGLRRRDMKDALAPQDHLYTVVERGAGEDRARVVGTLLGCLFGPEEPAAVHAALSDPRTRLVTLTITGSAYHPRPGSGSSHVASAFDYLSEALDQRRREGLAPFTVLSCDNLPENGAAARTATLAAARRRNELLAGWIARNVAFPSSVVDRITPETTKATRDLVARRFGIADRWPVVTEPFTQWVIEDAFCNERPPLEELGVRFVADVRPYAHVKKRMLNGGHCALGYLGCLLGHHTTDAAMADPLVRRYMEGLLADEIEPLLPAVAGLDLAEYRGTLLDRFANPNLGDQLARLCGRGSTKMPAYLLPSLRDARRRGRPHKLLVLAVASWLRYLRGVDLAGEAIAIRDDRLHELKPPALAGGDDPLPLLSVRSIFGTLGDDLTVVDSIEQALQEMRRDGLRATLERHLTGEAARAAA